MSEVAEVERAGTLNHERIIRTQTAWKRVGELHRRLVQYRQRTEEARDRAIDLSLLDDKQFEHVVDVLTAVSVNVSIAVTTLAEQRPSSASDADGIRYELRPARISKPAEPEAGDEEQHAWRRLIAFRQACVQLLHYLARRLLVVAELAEHDHQLGNVLLILTAVQVNVQHALDTIDRLQVPDEHAKPAR